MLLTVCIFWTTAYNGPRDLGSRFPSCVAPAMKNCLFVLKPSVRSLGSPGGAVCSFLYFACYVTIVTGARSGLNSANNYQFSK